MRLRPLTLLEVPYDCGRLGERMGRGPQVLAEALPARLGLDGDGVELTRVRLPEGFFAEVAAVQELQRAVRTEVAGALAAGRLPVVLAGNCGYAALGATAALPPPVGVLWLDAHADFNTPETSPSGFFDGTALATLCGHCWRGVTAGFAGFAPLAEERVVLLGARDLDAEEQRALAASAVCWLRPAELRRDPTLLADALDALAGRAERLYLHLDLDVVDPGELRANRYATPDGPSVDELVAAIGLAAARLEVAAVAITAYDPAVDVEARGPAVAARLLAAACTHR
jgi:arginase